MKKYLSLIFKDLIIMKNYLWFTALIIVGIPFLFLTTTPMGTGLAAFSMTYILALYMTVQSLAYYESKYRKAETVLNAAPYSKQAIVISRYIVSLLIYIVSLLVYVILSLAIPYLETLTAPEALIALLIGSFMMGVLQPLTYKFGIEKTRYINMIVMIGVGIGFPYIVKAVVGGNVNFEFINSISPVLVSSLTLLLAIVILVVSAIISIKVYKKKEF